MFGFKKNKCLVEMASLEEIKDLILEAKLEAKLDAKKEAYPIGSVYMNLRDGTSPEELLGFGAWERIKDRSLYALGDSGSVGDMGGSETHYHTPASVNVGGCNLTYSQMPGHNHRYYDTVGKSTAQTGESMSAGLTDCAAFVGRVLVKNDVELKSTLSAGSVSESGNNANGETHTHKAVNTSSSSNMPPYMKAYMWVRVA